MKRRAFMGLLGTAALGFPRLSTAQTSAALPLVGVLVPGWAEFNRDSIAGLRLGLQDAGFIEGANYSLAMRFADGDFERLQSLAGELGALNPRVIVAAANAAGAIRRSFPNLPLVFTGFAADPVALGFAESYARPGKMATGNVMNAIGGEEAMTQKADRPVQGPCPGSDATA
jgi:putative ABC transport system substrate-binding protein